MAALAGVLAGGCTTAPGRRVSSGEPGVVSPSHVPSNDAAARKLARAQAHYAAGVLHELNDEVQPALDEFCKAVAEDPNDEWLVLEVSRRLLDNKQPEKALEMLQLGASRPDASGAVLSRLAFVLLQLGKLDQAAAAGRLAVKRAPESLAGYHNLYLIAAQNHKEQDALKILDEAGRQESGDFDFLIGLAELCANAALEFPARKTALQQQAVSVLVRAEKLCPSAAIQRLRLADGFSLAGDREKAARHYLAALGDLPELPLLRERVHAKLAEIYLRESDHKNAAEQLQAIIKEDPTNAQARFFLGALAFDDRRFAEAAETFESALMLDPNLEQAYYNLALCQITLQKPAGALVTLDKARKKFAQNFLLEFWTALAHTEQKQWKEALPFFTSAEVIGRAVEPQRLTQLFYLQFGSACERAGDYEQAERHFKRCLQLAPDMAEAMNCLGYMWAEQGTHLEEALQLLEKAVAAEPDNFAYLDSLAWALFKLNRPKEALDYALKAVAGSREPDPTLYDHLGDIYQALDIKDKAQEAWRKSLAIEPSEVISKKLTSPVEQQK